jgi:hypothetical protein
MYLPPNTPRRRISARGQIRLELRIEVATSGLDALVPVILLHPIIDRDRFSHIGAGPEIDDGNSEHLT